MTLVTAVKDYIEVVHKLIETSPHFVVQHSSYGDVLTILNFSLSTLKQISLNILSFEWLKQLWYFPILVPDIASSMVSEISILDGNFHNMLTFLDKPIIIGNSTDDNFSLPLTCFEKLLTGLINSLFLWIPTSTATFICFRRFLMQGVEAGFAAALGTMIANIFWLTSLLFGLRFIVVPWVSLDLFRYWLGFLLLMKYFWDNRFAYKEVKHTAVFGEKTLKNIFCFHFLLAFTEQTSLYPFLSNFSISAQSTMLESFPSDNLFNFSLIHLSYLLGISIGSYSLINLICWFWQDPAYRFYFWLMNKFKKLRVADIVRPIHLLFQSITVAFAFSSLPYFGIEYAITNPLGFLPNDQAFHQFKQTSFLIHPTSPTYYRSRLNFPNQKFFRYEDWAEYYHRNIPLDTSLYDQGSYRLYTMEDLNYGTDYEWIRRRSDKIKIRSRLKRLRWFPRNWANRLWEFTKTWSRRNVAWRNDILNTYQYSWDSKTPIIWGKLVREELFPKFRTNQVNNFSRDKINKTDTKINNNWGSLWGSDPDWASKFLWNQTSSNEFEKKFWWNWQSRRNLEDNNNWWKWINNSQAFSSDQYKLTATSEKFAVKPFFNLKKNTSSDFKMNKDYKADFWKPQDRLISLYFDKSRQKELTLEFSTLRKFARKLTARFKTSKIQTNFNSILVDKNNFEQIALKILLIFPQIKEWNSFQLAMNNINRVLWWSRLTHLNKSNANKNALESNKNFLLPNIFLNERKYSLINQKPIFVSLNNNAKKAEKLWLDISIIDKKEFTKNHSNILFSKTNKIGEFFTGKSPTSFSNKKMIKFKNIQKKLNQLPELNKNFQIENGFFNLKNQENADPNYKFLPNLKNQTKDQNVNKTHFISNQPPVIFSQLLNLGQINVTLLHPLNFYLHKEQNFKKKLRFYGVKNISNENNSFLNKKTNKSNFPNKNIRTKNQTTLMDFFSESSLDNQNNIASQKNEISTKIFPINIQKKVPNISINNLPIFNFYMKTYFQNYKPTRLYIMNTKMKRQLGVSASARRKGRDYTNKLLKRSKILSGTPWIRQWVNQSGFLTRRKRLETWIKRQHYDPNELWSKIMKTDVDLFMSRQPSSHFLTNTEEKLLHLRRFLLFEHYDSLRWYTFMSHYRTMKNKIGGTKSFTSKLYNQQFKGTFHKVRHLFSLTPSSSNGSLLKFDQPLYNFENSNIKIIGNESLIYENNIKIQNFSQIHEELTKQSHVNNIARNGTNSQKNIPNDFVEESTQKLQQSILHSTNIRQDFIQNIIQQKDFDKLTHSLILEQKLNENNLLEGKSLISNDSIFNKRVQTDKLSTFSSFILNSHLKEKLRTKFMISLFQKRQKWTKDYKKTSEKLWKKWKLKILWLNRKNQFFSIPDKFNIPLETSLDTSNSIIRLPLKQSTNLNNKVSKSLLLLMDKRAKAKMSFSSMNKEKLLLKNYPQKLYEIKKLKHLIEINQKNKINPLFNDIEINNSSFFNVFNTKTIGTADNNTFQKQTSSDTLLVKTAIRQSLKKAINIQSNNKLQETLPVLSIASSNSLKKFLKLKRMEYQNTLVNLNKNATKQAIKKIYKNALMISTNNPFKLETVNSNEEFQFIKRPFYFKIGTLIKSLKSDIYKNKFWNYSLINQIKNRNQHFFNTTFEKKSSNLTSSDFIFKSNLKNTQDSNSLKNIILYKKNFILRERSNLQNYVLLRKILLNESSSSFTHHQIRPLPGTRAKTLYEKQAISESNVGSNAFKVLNEARILSFLEPKPFMESTPSIINKIHAYKNRKWLELYSVKNSNLNFRIKMEKTESKKDFQTNILFKDLSLIQKINSTWSLFINKVQNNFGEIESNRMDQKLQNKLVQNQISNLIKNNNILGFKNSLQESTVLINNKLSGTVFADNLGLSDNIRQKFTKVIQSRQKPTNFIDLVTRIRRTKQRRKRQKFSIKRNLLRRHLNRKNRRKLFVKTKEITNQRIVLDRKDELKERLFFTKIEKINSSLPQFKIIDTQTSMDTVKSNIKTSRNELPALFAIKNFTNSEPLYSGTKLLSPYFKINDKSPTSDLNEVDTSHKFKKLQKRNINKIELNNAFIDNFVVWLLSNEKTNNLKKENFLNSPEDKIFVKNLFEELNKVTLDNDIESINSTIFNLKQIPQNKVKIWWLSNKILNTDKNLLTNFDKKQSSESYLSSLLRTSRYINEIIINQSKNIKSSNGISSSNGNYPDLTIKLNEYLKNPNELKNEKNRLRRNLRKSIVINSTNTQKNYWLKKLLKSEFTRNNWILSTTKSAFSDKKTNKNIFLNNIALSTWVQKSNTLSKLNILQKNPLLTSGQSNKSIPSQKQELNYLIKNKTEDYKENITFRKKARFYSIVNNFSVDDSSKNMTNLIDFNKYIITARTNPSKLSRQQIRKKTLKRRIIRTKRIERLKTLEDHPLKFRSDQNQNFYNIQNSLKKWKNFGFISSKLKFNTNLWENIMEKNELFDKNLFLFSSNPFEKSFEKNFSSERDYKPLRTLKILQTSQTLDNTNFSPTQTLTKKDNNINIFSNVDTNLNNSNYDIFYKLYSNLFLNSLDFSKATESINNKSQTAYINNNNLSVNPMDSFAQSDIKSNNNLFTNQQKLLLNINPIPFYAGWDETMRKFVITNRLLSRKDAGYNLNFSSQNPTFSQINSDNTKIDLKLETSTRNIEFSAWPLKGTNSATTLFSQFPFMTSPQTSLNYSSTQILQLKGGTKYQKTPEFEELFSNNKYLDNKWISVSKEKFNITNSFNLLHFKQKKRIKNQIKSNKNENQDRIRKYGQVISNVTIPAYRKNRRVALFAPLNWRGKKQTTKSILMDTTKNVNINQKLQFDPLFKYLNGKTSLIDKKTSAKIRLLRTFKQGNRAQTKLPRIDRFLMLKRTSGSSWKNKISSSRRKKRRIKPIQSHYLVNKTLQKKTTNKLVNEGGWETTRFIIKKRKKRGNNKNPRLRGDKNIRATKRQLRQKLYLRPKKRPLRRRSLGAHFQNKLNYWRRQSLNISSKINSKHSNQINEISQNNNIKSLNESNNLILNSRISFTKNLIENSKYAQITTEWNNNKRLRQLYRNLFKNPPIHFTTLYETLPAHSRSIPIIKNLPTSGSSVKTLNRVVKWNSADGAARFHRVNLAYGWALELFLKNLQQKIKFKKQWITNNKSVDQTDTIKDHNIKNSQNLASEIVNNHQKDLTHILNKQLSHFSSTRSFKRRSIKLRQLSYTMSMRLYDRWFFYYYSSKNLPLIKKEQMEQGIRLNLLNDNKFTSYSSDEKRDLFSHLKKFLTFHLNDTQTSFRAYLKTLRLKAKKQADKATETITQKLPNNIESNLSEKDTVYDTNKKRSLYDFKVLSNSDDKTLNLDQNNVDSNPNQISNKTLLKKEKKLQEDRFFFAQFNRPPLVDDSRLTREVNRHYPLNGGFVWPGDYLRLKTIQLPKELMEEKMTYTPTSINYLPYFYLQQINPCTTKNKASTDFSLNSELTLNFLNKKKLPNYLEKWNTLELNQSINMLNNLELSKKQKDYKIGNKINNLKQILSIS
uniref:Hypothetical chloroplast RF1 n=1 Tax=Aphanochaete confervicola TaxID=764104 RepID=A0A6H1XE22_9CHLO|nr:hypothetical chloroplast RF1 [Aphanochaete confervicola]QJA13844.1 hypothetical chloroplast RF1 [Aphanochaete confervicola]